MIWRSALSWCLVAAGVPLAEAAAVSAKDAEFFELRVRPVLAKNCYSCHTTSRMSGLELDSREHMLKGGNSGRPAVVPGKPEESLLIQAVSRTHERYKMPPQGKLTDEEIADLTAWVKMGAIWPESAAAAPKSPQYVITAEQRAFWAFQPVRNPFVPKVKDESWPKSAIDRFILAKLEDKGLKPVGPAGKRALLRRATYDLIGLPPTPNEMDAYLSDESPGAFAKVVDRLLASPHYGERWGRHWLDLARYSDGALGAAKDTPYANAFRYRDWVIHAFNEDMPYDLFVKAQIAGDLLPGPGREKLLAGLGFQALGPGPDDRVDVTARAFLGLTVGCAQCHDHKYDPIPTKDYYSLLGVFRSSENYEVPLAPETVVTAYKEHKKKIAELKDTYDDFLEKHSSQLAEILALKTSRFMVSAWKVMQGGQPDPSLDRETLERWIKYLKDPQKEHPYLKSWYELMARGASEPEVRKVADSFQAFVLAVNAEKRAMDDRNYVKLGGAKGAKDERTRQYTNLESPEIEKYYLWRDLASEPYSKSGFRFYGGVYYYTGNKLERFLGAEWRERLRSMRKELTETECSLPTQYSFLHTLRDKAKPANVRVAIRGDAQNPGEEAPRRFLAILCQGEPQAFTKGSGRLELAEAIASADNPLTARVMVNRVWQLHFGFGIVRSPSNFGRLGERPTHPELLDYLAHRFVENHWSIKSLHREIMLSATYALGTDHSEQNYAQDPDNRLHWRANLLPRLDAEALRDSLLAVAGDLNLSVGGPPEPLTDDNHRRTIYGLVERTKLDSMLALFDFPNPNNTSEQRMVTVGPLQRLFFMNNTFVAQEAKALAGRLQGDDTAKITQAYRLLFGRRPDKPETELGLDFLRQSHGAWPQYAQVLMSSAEFTSVN